MKWMHRSCLLKGSTDRLCPCQHAYRKSTKHKIESAENLSQECTDWWRWTWLGESGSGRCQMRKMMANNYKNKLNSWLGVTMLSYKFILLRVQSSLSLHPLAYWCCSFPTQWDRDWAKSESNSSAQSSLPTLLSLESAEPTPMPQSSRLTAINCQ